MFKNLSQTTLLLRLLGGGYLIYLGISILLDGTASLPIAAGAVIFLLACTGLLVITLPAVLRQIEQVHVPGSSDKDEK